MHVLTLSAHRDWLRRATSARPPTWRHRGSAHGARQLQQSRTDAPALGRGGAATVAPSSLTAMGMKRSLIPDSVNTVRSGTRTRKGCSWERSSAAVSPPIKLREEEDEKHLEMSGGYPEGNLVKDVHSNIVCVFWAGTMSAVCASTVVSHRYLSPSHFVLFILRTPPAGSPFKGTVPVFFSISLCPQSKLPQNQINAATTCITNINLLLT